MTKEQKVIRAKVGLLELARQLGNVSQACEMTGYSRGGFYRFKDLYEAGELALQELTRRKPILKNRVDPALKSKPVELSLDWLSQDGARRRQALGRDGAATDEAPAEPGSFFGRRHLIGAWASMRVFGQDTAPTTTVTKPLKGKRVAS